MPWLKARWRANRRVTSKRSGWGNSRSSWLAAPQTSITREPAGMSTADGDVAGGRPRQDLGRGLHTVELFHGVGPQGRIATHQGPLVGIAGQQHDAAADQARGGVVAGQDEQQAEAEKLLVAQAFALHLGRQ